LEHPSQRYARDTWDTKRKKGPQPDKIVLLGGSEILSQAVRDSGTQKYGGNAWEEAKSRRSANEWKSRHVSFPSNRTRKPESDEAGNFHRTAGQTVARTRGTRKPEMAEKDKEARGLNQ
ncbi:hypothetical protein KI387_040823, partial [Taxus chinensis]